VRLTFTTFMRGSIWSEVQLTLNLTLSRSYFRNRFGDRRIERRPCPSFEKKHRSEQPYRVRFLPNAQYDGSFVLATWKSAEDGNGTIARLQETAGQSADVTVTLPRSKMQFAALCNSVEDRLHDLSVTNNQIQMTFHPNEVLRFVWSHNVQHTCTCKHSM
jgi:Glycosyl hydrolases family 38 C-terminal beta sandwich domain